MNRVTHAYLELTALPEVGAALLDPRPAWVFRGDGTAILWANAAGLAFFEEANMGAMLTRPISASNPIVNQLARLARVLPSNAPRMEILRFTRGFNLTALPTACRRINLADGTSAVLAISAVDAQEDSITSRAENLVDQIASEDCLVAIIDSDRRVIAASGGVHSLTPASTSIDALTDLAGHGEDLIVKQVIEIAGKMRPAGIARFRDSEDSMSLLIVGPPEVQAESVEDRTAKDDASAPQSSQATPAPVAMPAPTPNSPADQSTISPAIRFLWQVDRDQRFTFVSSELGEIVGTDNANIVGTTWRDTAKRLHIDPQGSIQSALDSRSQWNGIKIYWPIVDRSLRVAAELSAFAISERGVFVGYRGFGILRPDDKQIIPNLEETASPIQTVGSTTPPTKAGDEIASSDEASTSDSYTEPQLPAKGDVDIESDSAKSSEQGLRIVSDLDTPSDKTPLEKKASPPVRPAARSNVVPLPGTKANNTPNGQDHLSGIERDAFRRIAAALEASKAPSAAATDGTTDKKTQADRPSEKPASAPNTQILDRLPIGIVVFRGDETLFANRRFLEILGYENRAEFVEAGGRNAFFRDGGTDWTETLPDKAEGQLSVRRKDGERCPVEARLQTISWADDSALLLSIREQPAPQEPVALPSDLIDEISSAEARLDELEAILDTATDGVLVIERRGNISNVNRSAEALFGVEAGDILGTPFTDLLADESRKEALDYLDGLASNGVASVLNDGREVIGKVPQGGLIPLFMTMGRLGKTGKFCAVLRDITHWKNAEEELVAARRAAETANAQKSEFLAKISHEIRTPLNAIIGFSEVMIEERFGPINNSRYRDYLRDIHVSGSHLMSLINDLLDLSKIEAGKLELSFESVSANETIQECVALMQPQANRERIIIRTSLSSEVPNIVIDPRSLRQILLNLLSNAIKFTQAGGQVIVSTGIEDQGEVVIRIRDTGVGMSEKDVETALMPFRQLTTSGQSSGEGTGLGLPLTKALVEANRALFSIDSALDQGTLVKITIPTTRVLAG